MLSIMKQTQYRFSADNIQTHSFVDYEQENQKKSKVLSTTCVKNWHEPYQDINSDCKLRQEKLSFLFLKVAEAGPELAV